MRSILCQIYQLFANLNKKLLIKVTVCILLMGYILYFANLRELTTTFQNVKPFYILLLYSTTIPLTLISTLKWMLLLKPQGINETRFIRLWALYHVGMFFSNFLPTAIGGDVYRAYRTMGKAERRMHAFSAVILERLIGIFALLVLGFVSTIILLQRDLLVHRQLAVYALVILTVGVLFAVIAWISFSHDKIWARLKRARRLEPLIDSIRVIYDNRRHFPSLIASSFLYQAIAIYTISVLFAATQIPGTLFQSGFTAVASGIAGILPISINGIGVVEGSFVVAAMETNLPYAEAVLVTLLIRAFMLFASILFGLLYAAEPTEQRGMADG